MHARERVEKCRKSRLRLVYQEYVDMREECKVLGSAVSPVSGIAKDPFRRVISSDEIFFSPRSRVSDATRIRFSFISTKQCRVRASDD